MSPELTADAVPIGVAATAELTPEVHDAFRGSSWGEHPVPGTLPDILHLIRRIEGGDDPADAVDQLTLLERIRHAAGAAQLRVMLGLEATRRAEQGPGVLAKAECALAQAWPTMFAYQFLVKAEPA